MSNLNYHLNLGVNVRDISNANHYGNLKKHALRQGPKYKGVNYFVKVLFDDGRNYPNAKHIVIEGNFGDGGDDAEKDVIQVLSKYYAALSELVAVCTATIVSGENEPGKYIYPALHVLCKPDAILTQDYVIKVLNRLSVK